MNELNPTVVAAVAGFAGAVFGAGLSIFGGWLIQKSMQNFQREKRRKSILRKAWYEFMVVIMELSDVLDEECEELPKFSSATTDEEKSAWCENMKQVYFPRFHEIMQRSIRAKCRLLMVEDDEKLLRELVEIQNIILDPPLKFDPTPEQAKRLKEYQVKLNSLSKKIGALLQKLARERYFV